MKTSLPLLLSLLLGPRLAAAQTGADPAAPAPGETPRPFSKPFIAPDGVDIDKLKDAAQQAAAQLWKSYVGSVQGTQPTRFAVLPLPRDIDGDYMALQIRNKFTEICGPQGMELYTRMDKEWDALLKEIAWGENFGDTMDAATIQKFGRIKGVQAVVFSRISGATRTDREGVKLRVNAQVFEVETGRQLWGREIVATEEGTLVPVLAGQLIKDYRQWLLYGGGALALLIVLSALMRMGARAARPR